MTFWHYYPILIPIGLIVFFVFSHLTDPWRKKKPLGDNFWRSDPGKVDRFEFNLTPYDEEVYRGERFSRRK